MEFFESKWKPSPERFEAGTPNVADAIGLHARWTISTTSVARHVRSTITISLAAHTRPCSALPGIRILGPKGARGGLVSFAFPDVHAHDIVTFADQDGIALRGGHHCNQPLMKKLGLTSTTRASFYVYNTHGEIEALATCLRKIIKFFSG